MKKKTGILLCTLVLLTQGQSCTKSKTPPPAKPTVAPQVSPNVYFPFESKPELQRDFSLNELLEEYITPHLALRPLSDEEKEKEVKVPENAVAFKFNYPMVREDQINLPKKQESLSFIPYRSGTYIWLTPQILAFTPDRLWQGSVTAVLPLGIKSLNGYELLEPVQQNVDYYGKTAVAGKILDEVEQGSPHLIFLNPSRDSTLGNGSGISLVFDQPVLIDYLHDKIKLEYRLKQEKEFKSLSFDLVHPKNPMINEVAVASDYVIQIQPKAPFALGSEVKVTFAAGVKEAKEVEVLYDTPVPLVLESIACHQWANCQMREEVTTSGQKIQVDGATGFLKLKFNDNLNEDSAQQIEITPRPADKKIEVSGKELHVNWDWKPDTAYTIQFKPQFRNSFNFPLQKPLQLGLKTGHLLPALQVPVGLKTVDKNASAALDLRWLNLNQLSVRKYPVFKDDIPEHLTQLWQDSEEGKFYYLPEIEKPDTLDFPSNPQANQWQSAALSPQDLLKNSETNIFYLQYSTSPFVPQDPDTAQKMAALVQITDLGLGAKKLEDGIVVMVSSLSSGKPQPEVKISVSNLSGEIVAEGASDENGLIYFPEKNFPKVKEHKLIIAETEDDLAFLWMGSQNIKSDFFEVGNVGVPDYGKVQDSESDDAGDSYASSSHPAFSSVLFSDRGVYKPGQVVHLKGILRPYREGSAELLPDPNAKIDSNLKMAAPSIEGKIVQFQLIGSDNQAQGFSAKVNALGGFSVDWKVPEDFKLGSYSIAAQLDNEQVAKTSLQIADVTQVPFEIKLDSLAVDPVLGTWKVQVNSQYFFGLPVSQGKLGWELYSEAEDFSPLGYGEYIFKDFGADEDYSSEAALVESRIPPRAALGEQGQNNLIIPIKSAKAAATIRGPEKFYLDVTVRDLAGAVNTQRIEKLVHFSDYYIGQRRHGDFAAGELIAFEWVALSPDEKVLSGIAADAQLYKLEGHGYYEEGLSDSYYFETDAVKTLVASCHTQSGAGRQGCALPAQAPGSYLLRLSSKDPQGREVVSSQPIYVTGSGMVSGITSKRYLVKPLLDKRSYSPGEIAKVKFENPLNAAYATLTVEGNGLLYHKTTKIDAGMVELDLPVEAYYAPNVYVGLYLASGRQGNSQDALGNDVNAPTYRAGYAPMKVNLDHYRLKIGIAPDKTDYQPQEKVALDLSVIDYKGQGAPNAELTVYVVDEAALKSTGYQIPEVVKPFFPESPLAVEVADSRSGKYGREFKLSIMEKGQIMGDGGEFLPERLGVALRRNFSEVFYWNPEVKTDASGNAKVEFTLPDSTTEFRVMVVAHDGKDHFGSENLSLKAALPIAVEALAPAFLIRGDHFDAKVRVQNSSNQPRSVTVELASPLSSVQTVQVAPQSSSVVNFPLDTPESLSELPLRVIARSGAWSDAIEKKIPIQEKYELVTRQISGDFDLEQSVLLDRGQLGAGAVKLTLSFLPIPDLTLSLKKLIDVPGTDVEKVLYSLAAGSLARQELKDFLPEQNFSEDVISKLLEKRLSQLLAYRSPQDGLAKGISSPVGDPILNAKALIILKNLKLNDEQKKLYNELKSSMEVLEALTLENPNSEQLAIRLWNHYAAAVEGKANAALTTQLLQQATNLKASDLGLLLLSLAKEGRKSEAKKLLESFLKIWTADGALKDLAYSRDYKNLDYSFALLALLELEPENTLVDPLARQLFNLEKDGAWRSEEESYFALKALSQYLNKKSKSALPKVELLADGQKIDLQESKKINAFQSQIVIPATSKLTLKNLEKKPVYWSLGSQYRQDFSSNPEDNLTRGVHLFTTVEDSHGNYLTEKKMKLGELYHFRIYVKTTENISDFFLKYPVLAGLKPLAETMQSFKRQADTSGGEGEDSENSEASSKEESGDRRYVLIERAMSHLNYSEVNPDYLYYSADLPTGFYCFDFYAQANQTGEFTQAPAIAGSKALQALVGTMASHRLQVVE